MRRENQAWSLIQTGKWGTIAPTYFFRFNGPGGLYCEGCSRNIRLVSRTETLVRCLDCGKAISIEIT